MTILTYLAIFFIGFIVGAARERVLFENDWVKSKHDLEDLKQIYIKELEKLNNDNKNK